MSTAASPHPSDIPRRMVLMGVAGCGKSSVGAALAARLGAVYRDGDDLHPAENIAKMSKGIPLEDADRWPWLTRVSEALAAGTGPTIIGCSALKRAYRQHIESKAGGPVTFIHLAGTVEVIEKRMKERQGHFMPPALLSSQFAALEPPGPDENAISVDIDQPLDAVVEAIAAQLGGLRE
ncbi:IdnK (plasmid) [Sinorhizobium fredii HH103]|uniref:Gluconokinase n=1 Tax=Sinorhizobium fredii (strain HH103) TaxID=1117943 RepID=G9AEI8_SINF1|nr:gluconokinase [Sinorhizobium fredii]CCE99470.1 IdnK [Sinorhizobium fredii HH103]